MAKIPTQVVNTKIVFYAQAKAVRQPKYPLLGMPLLHNAGRDAPIRACVLWLRLELEETQALMGAFLTNIVTIPTKIMPNSKISIVATILVLEKQLYLQQKFN